MKHLITFLYAVLAGVAISIGGLVNLASDSRLAGAALFSVGLFTVCTLGLGLFTGRVCYVFDNPPSYAASCALLWLGNLCGAWLCGTAVRLTRLAAAVEKAQALSQAKLDDSPLSLFILGVFCNILIYIAVESYRSNPHQLGKYLGIFLGVVVFVQTGLEHCVADMFYFSAAGAWGFRALGCILVITAGNVLGGVVFPLCGKLRAWAEKR